VAYGAQFGVLGALIWGWPAYSFILAAGGMAAVVKRVAAAGQDARAAGDGSPPRPAALAHDGGTVPAPVPSDAESAALAALDPRGRAHPWHWRPGWQRGAVRLGAILLAAAVTWGALFHPGGTIGILAIVTAAGVRYTGWRLYRLARRWRYPAWDWHDITRNRRKFAQDTWTAVKRPCVHYWYFRRPGTRSQTRSAPRRPG
jgi:hypothetical protein